MRPTASAALSHTATNIAKPLNHNVPNQYLSCDPSVTLLAVRFQVPGLAAGRRYMLTLHSSNERGRSDLFVKPVEVPADAAAGRTAEISELSTHGYTAGSDELWPGSQA